MKYFTSIVAVLLLQFSGWAQDKIVSKDEAALASQIEILRQGIMTADGAKLAAVTAPELSYGHSFAKIENRSEFMDHVLKKNSIVYSYEFQNQTISIVGESAIVRHILVSHSKDDGVDKDTKIGVLQVWQKQKKQWLLIARQAYKLPTP